ncbi:D-alanine--poly(phosphoribitol) ligase subunit 2 [Acinetobacter baumannii]|uniref:phosphopantetheine-binding protein n=1 Tax=Acinetobacter baumannii TaxID=470 RepID=UPI000DE6E6D9|nr:phosphopantetheine-binding protein [Acinetobacter baumannii]MBJ9579006.1 acyl carrier protein [Acinetobacter baumannii]MDC5579586.1 phosphopantetheine-binding protein [Acinetobacter baumannii]SSS46251.1 D-alanine--poly(phosphoribitol) ligase subunit 2 [Acinetobacter baumannii]
MLTKFAQEVISFLEEATKEEKGNIEVSTELIDSGIVDSLSIVGLIAFLEKKTNKTILYEEIDLEDFSSVESIVSKYSLQLP